MISESASEHSNMSPSPPNTKSTKLDTASMHHHNRTIKKEREQRSERQLVDNKHHNLVETSQSKVKKKLKSKSKVKQHDDPTDDEAGEDNPNDEDEFYHRTKNNQLLRPNDIGIEPRNERHNFINKSKKNKNIKTETLRNDGTPEDVEPIISHKNKSPTSGNINTNTTNPMKKVKKEKKRYQEMVIDGFTITAFRTWEDLQDEMNDRISANIKMNSHNEDIGMPNTSCSSNAASSLNASKESVHPSPSLNTATSLLQPEQSSSSSFATTGISNSTPDTKRNITNETNDVSRKEVVADSHRHGLVYGNINGTRDDKTNENRSNSRGDNEKNPSLLQRTLRQNGDHEPRQYHDNPQSRDEYHKSVRMQSLAGESVIGNARQQQSNSSVNTGYPYGVETTHSQYRSNRPIDIDPKRTNNAQLDPQRNYHPGQPSNSNYPRRSPSPKSIHPIPSASQAAQQYFQHYQQLYQQMHNSAQQQSHNLQKQPQPPPHLQNPYMALMNQYPHSSHLKGPGHSLPGLGPLPQHPPIPMAPEPMMGISPFASPYTITDTIISRQTSIIPSAALPPIPSGLDHLTNSRYGRHTHLSALEHTMAPPAFSQHHNPSAYMPSPTERSFMEFARSYANASNLSSGYNNFMNQAVVPKNNLGTSNLYGHLDRMAMDQQHRSMMQTFGAGGPNPFSGFNPSVRPPTISMFPPHYYP